MSLLPDEPAAVDMDNTEDWTIRVTDLDVNGEAISHLGESLLIDLHDADGNLVISASTANGRIALADGTTNTIVITIPWGSIQTIPAGQFFGTLVTIISDTSRRKILDLIVRNEIKP